MNDKAELKRKRIEAAVKIAVVLGVSFLVAPFIFIAIKGMLGLLVAAAIGVTAVNFAPIVAHRLAVWRLKALKLEASQNPIETLELQLKDRAEALDKTRDNIRQFYAVVQKVRSEIDEHNQKYPGRTSQYEERYQKMLALLQLRSDLYKKAKGELAKFSDFVDEQRSDWKVAQSMAEANKLANVAEDFQSKLMQNTAIETIQMGLNTAFADLEVSLLDEDKAPAVEIAENKQVAGKQPRQLPPLDLDLETPSSVNSRQPIKVQ